MTDKAFSLPGITVAAIALGAGGTLLLQTGVDLARGESLGPALWIQARYFTNLMVALVMIVFAATWLRGRWPSASLSAAVVVQIVLVGVVYHALLAATHHPEGWDVLVNIMQHTAIPLAVLVAWWLFAPKAGLTYWHPLWWLAIPLGYVAYAILRGSLDGKYPYFFLDPVKTGWPGVAGFVIGLGALFYAAGALAVMASRRRVSPELPSI